MAWNFMKSDHEAAYKQLPLKGGHSELAVIALRNPCDGRRYGFLAEP